MANTAANVRVGVTGKVHTSAAGTAPTDATTALSGWTDLGYISEDGLTETPSVSTNDIKAWGGDIVRTIVTEHKVEFAFTLLETSAAVLEVYYNDPDADTSGWVVSRTDGLRQKWVFEVIDGASLRRLYLPDGQVTGVDAITHATEEAIGYGVTITAYPDNTGVKVYGFLGTAS